MRRWALFGIAALALVVAAWGAATFRGSIAGNTVLAAPSGTGYSVYFTRPVDLAPGAAGKGGLDALVIDDLEHAQRSIDVAMFDLDLRSVTDALRSATARGVPVRLVLDAQNLDKPATAWMVGELQRAGVGTTFDRRRAFMHNKFVVVDEQVVWTGSANMTANDTYRNNNNAVRFVSREVAANYRAKFDALYAGRGGPGNAVPLPYPQVQLGTTSFTIAFAPDEPVTAAVVERVNRAQRSLDVLAFTWTSPAIAAAVVAAHHRGVHVRVVYDERSAAAAVSTMAELNQAGAEVQTDGNCATMHDKVIIVDGRDVITGSFNWTNAAQAQNDENIVMVDDLLIGADYEAEFQRIWNTARHPPTCK